MINSYLNYIDSYAIYNSKIDFINLKLSDGFEKVQGMLVSELLENYESITVLGKKIEIVLQCFGYEGTQTEATLNKDQQAMHD